MCVLAGKKVKEVKLRSFGMQPVDFTPGGSTAHEYTVLTYIQYCTYIHAHTYIHEHNIYRRYSNFRSTCIPASLHALQVADGLRGRAEEDGRQECLQRR